MRKLVLIASILFLMPFVGFSQYYWDYGAKLGASNYLGDIGGLSQSRRPFVLDMKMQETRWDIGGYVRYKLRDPWSVEAQLNWVRVSGADSLTAKYDPRRGRNLNFRNDIIQFSAFGEWTFFENPDLGNTYRYENAFSAYLFAGISVFYQCPFAYNPYHYAWNAQGQMTTGGPLWVNLHPLETEGVHYHIIQPGIPLGAGFNFTIKKKYRIGWSITWTKTFTDYLDDISTVYPNPDVWKQLGFSKQMQAEAAYFSNRATAASASGVGLQEYGLQGDQRGIVANKDNFITTTVDVGYVIRGRSNIYRAHYSGLFSKNRFKIRRRRAKF
ncbi:MAG TPA: hypothetical protein VK890_08565 [Bacteroidia bacterium]|jgi:hypothetical protein|nr:hypothetical protein [Bacteroidia bacterium]